MDGRVKPGNDESVPNIHARQRIKPCVPQQNHKVFSTKVAMQFPAGRATVDEIVRL
jgi:hypothetical protein